MRLEAISLIEPLGRVVYWIDDDGHGGNLGGVSQRAMQRIEHEEISKPLALIRLIECQTTNQGCGEFPIAREFPAKSFREISQSDVRRTERVVASNAPVISVDQQVNSGDVPSLILASLFAHVTIERFDSTTKCRAIMLLAEEFKPKARSTHRLFAKIFEISTVRLAKLLVRLGRIQQRLDE